MSGAAWHVLEYLRQGGWVMVPLAVVSWVMWTLIIERLRTFAVLRREDLSPRAAAAWLDAGARGAPPAGRGLGAALLREYQRERSGLARLDRQVLRQCAQRLRGELDQRLGAIAVLAGVAPLLGLLGTVLGMIQTFDVISYFGTGNARAMAGGISVALITTQTGLLVAIPGLLMSNRLARAAQLLKTGLDENTALLARHIRDDGPEGGGVMINVRGTLRGGNGEVNINMGPLVDMVFLLLIFFVVTTSFVKESGIDVQRSTAATAEVKEHGNIMLGVSADGDIHFEGRRVDVRSVRALVERALAEDPESAVVIVADRNSTTGVVVLAMDQCRLAGAANVSLAARQPEER